MNPSFTYLNLTNNVIQLFHVNICANVSFFVPLSMFVVQCTSSSRFLLILDSSSVRKAFKSTSDFLCSSEFRLKNNVSHRRRCRRISIQKVRWSCPWNTVSKYSILSSLCWGAINEKIRLDRRQKANNITSGEWIPGSRAGKIPRLSFFHPPSGFGNSKKTGNVIL